MGAIKALVFVLLLSCVCFATIQITNYSIYPSILSPGTSGSVSLVAFNDENYVWENVAIIPLASKGIYTWEVATIDKIYGRSSTQVVLPFQIKADAEAGVYSLNLELNYGSHHEKFSIPLIVRDEPNIYIEKVSADKTLIRKGTELNLNMTIRNSGGKAKSVSIYSNSTVFSIKGGSKIYLEEIPKNASYNMGIKLIANSDIYSPQTLQFVLEYKDGLDNTYIKSLYVPIEVKETNFDIQKITALPEDFASGDEVTLNLSILNTGIDTSNLKVCISSDWFTENCKFVGYVSGGSQSSVTFYFVVPEKAKPTNMLVKLIGNEKEINYTVPLTPHEKLAKLVISRVKGENLYKETGGTIEIRIENYGNGEAKNVQANLIIDGIKYNSVVGKIESNDRGTASFYIPRFAEGGTIELPIEIIYTDSSGQNIKNEKIQLTILERQKTNLPVFTFVIVVLVIIVIYFIFKRKK
jgi:hypothetical protein